MIVYPVTLNIAPECVTHYVAKIATPGVKVTVVGKDHADAIARCLRRFEEVLKA